MLEVVEVSFRVGQAEVERRLVARSEGPHLGVVLCPDLETTAPEEGDPGWPGTADGLAEAVPATLLTVRAGPGYSPAAMVAEVRAAVRYLRSDHRTHGSVAVVGFGLGAAAAVVAGATDFRVRAVACLGAVGDLAGYASAPRLEELRSAGLADPEDEPVWRREFIAQSPLRHVGRLEGRPFLVVHGAADTEVPVSQVEELARLGGGRIEVLPTAGHRLRDHPVALEKVIDFLAGLAS